jgi:hypothetical protein
MSRAFEVEERVIQKTFGNQVVDQCEYQRLARLPGEGAAKPNEIDSNKRHDNFFGLIREYAAVFGEMIM